MTSKFNYKKSQAVGIAEPSIDTQVARLKRELNKTHESYQKQVYIILSKILTLRKRQIKNYDVSDLAREKGINMTFSSITYIFGFRYLSGETKRLIERGLLKTSTALYIIRQDTKFRNPELQNRVMKMYVDGKLNTAQITRIRSSVLLDNIGKDEAISDADASLIRAVYRISDMKTTLNTQRNLISNGDELLKLRKHLLELIDLVEMIAKTGDKIKFSRVLVRKYPKSSTDKLLDEEIEYIPN